MKESGLVPFSDRYSAIIENNWQSCVALPVKQISFPLGALLARWRAARLPKSCCKWRENERKRKKIDETFCLPCQVLVPELWCMLCSAVAGDRSLPPEKAGKRENGRQESDLSTKSSNIRLWITLQSAALIQDEKSCKQFKIGVFVLMHLHLAFVSISFLALTGSIFEVFLAFTVLVSVLSQPADMVH